MKHCFFLVFIISIINLTSFAQLQAGYVFQKDDTVLKKQYFEQSKRQKELLIASVSSQDSKYYKEAYEDQFKQIGNLLQSSRAVTAPEANGYLQSVLQKIIDANSELKGKELRVIFSRDWWPNAYSMGDGTIAVNAGLMVFLENEAELVFIICHELSHYYLQHTQKAIKKFVEAVNSPALKEELKKLSKQEYKVNQRLEELMKTLVFDSRQHSRSSEAEADMQAFRFMKKTGYDCNAIESSLRLLDKIDDTAFYRPLNLERVLNFSDYPFKKRWTQKESVIFGQLNEDDGPLTPQEKDSLKTHPDCSTRILLLSDSIKKTPAGKNFLADEKAFNKLKKDFFPEIVEECYKEENLSRNLYYCLQMLQANENISLAIYSVARCLNELYENQKNHMVGLTIDLENKAYPDDYNLLLRMLSRMRLDEIASLNYYFCKLYFEQMKDYPNFRDELKKLQKPQN
jgi:hypothetical protein